MKRKYLNRKKIMGYSCLEQGEGGKIGNKVVNFKSLEFLLPSSDPVIVTPVEMFKIIFEQSEEIREKHLYLYNQLNRGIWKKPYAFG